MREDEKSYQRHYERWFEQSHDYGADAEGTQLDIPLPQTLRQRLNHRIIEIVDRVKRYGLKSDGVIPVNPQDIGRGLADIWMR